MIEKKKPLFFTKVPLENFTCINITGTGPLLGNLSHKWCVNVQSVSDTFTPVSRGDTWWWCGDDRLFDRLPRNVTGYCALITFLLPVKVFSMSVDELFTHMASALPHQWQQRHRRSASWLTETDPTYIDAIGVPRGVPDEYKLVDQVAAGFESSICWWCINQLHPLQCTEIT